MGLLMDAIPRLTEQESCNLLNISILGIFVCGADPQGTEGIQTTNFPSWRLPQA
jgi:hypothetical protein